MRFRLKITLCMLCLLSLLFGVGGSVLISISFQTSLEREEDSAHETYQMLLNTLCAVNRIETWSDANDLSNALSQLIGQNASSWSGLRAYAQTEMIYETGETTELANISHEDISPESCFVSGVSGPDGEQYLRLSGAFVMGNETFYLDALQDITSIYEMRIQQQESYRKIYICMVVACALLTYSISWLLTRPLVKLSGASKEIARGDLAYRSDVRTSDEIGELSADFDYMASQMEKSVWDLKDAMSRQERFTRNFTHELKTPMAAIIGNADLIRLQALTPDEQAEAANYIFSEGKRLENLSLKLLDIFVMDKQELALRETSIGALIERVVSSQQTIFAEKKIKVSTECESGNCLMEPDLIWSLLVDLIDNAQKAMEQSGRIDIVSEMTAEGCRIRISDNGRGIPPEDMKHITEAFYRVDKLRSRKQNGVGLGLTLCAKIVELHNGTITFDSKVGEGTCITVELKEGRI